MNDEEGKSSVYYEDLLTKTTQDYIEYLAARDILTFDERLYIVNTTKLYLRIIKVKFLYTSKLKIWLEKGKIIWLVLRK